MDFTKLFQSVEKMQQHGYLDSEAKKLVKEFQKASDRMESRKREFKRDSDRGSRTTDHRFTL